MFIKDSQEIWTHGTYFTIPDSYVTKITDAETAIEAIKSNSKKSFNISVASNFDSYSLANSTTYTTTDDLTKANPGDIVNVIYNDSETVNFLIVSIKDSLLYLSCETCANLIINISAKTLVPTTRLQNTDITESNIKICKNYNSDKKETVSIGGDARAENSIAIGNSYVGDTSTDNICIGNKAVSNFQYTNVPGNILIGNNCKNYSHLSYSVGIGSNIELTCKESVNGGTHVVAIGCSNNTNKVAIGYNKDIIVDSNNKFGVRKSDGSGYITLEDTLSDIETNKLNKSDLVQATDTVSGIVKVDTALSYESENPIQNKAIANAFDELKTVYSKRHYNYTISNDLTSSFTMSYGLKDDTGHINLTDSIDPGTTINKQYCVATWANGKGTMFPYVIDGKIYSTSFYLNHGVYYFTPTVIGETSTKKKFYSDSQFTYQHQTPKSLNVCTKSDDGTYTNIGKGNDTLNFMGILELECKESDTDTTTLEILWNKTFGFVARGTSIYMVTISGPANETYFSVDYAVNSSYLGSYIEDLTTELNKKVDAVAGKGLSTNDYTTDEKTKLAGIAENANNYTLPKATSSVLGGVTVGSGITVTDGKISVPNATGSKAGLMSNTDKQKLDNLETLTKYSTIHYDSAKNIPFQSGSTTLRVNGTYLTDQASGGAECPGGKYGSYITVIANGQAVNDILMEDGEQIAIDKNGDRWEPDGTKWIKKYTALAIESEVLPNSTNPVQSKALYKVITDNEQVTAASLSDLNERLNTLLNRKRIFIKQYSSSKSYEGTFAYVTPGETIKFGVQASTKNNISVNAIAFNSSKENPTITIANPVQTILGTYGFREISMTIPTDVEDGDIYLYITNTEAS